MVETKDKFYFEKEFKKIDPSLWVIGSNKVLKALKNNELKEIYMASNIPKDREDEIVHLSDMAGVKVFKSDLNSKYLGPIVKKTFNVLVIGIKRNN